MSVLIKGMEMPQNCVECRFFAWKRGIGQHCAVDDRITFRATLDGFDVGYERNGDCPFIPVPPHGRLVDADKMKESIKNQVNVLMHFGDDDLHLIAEALKVGFLQEIDNAPTIIPASKESET